MPSPTSDTSPPPPDALVYVVDDDASVRRSLARLFCSARMPVVTLPSGQAFLDRVPHPGPACLVLDVRMPELGGLALQELLAASPEQIVFISGHADVPMCARTMRAGAVDFLTKPVDDEELLAAVRRALVRSAEAREAAAGRADALKKLGTLTPREREVLRCVISGMINKQIAERLGAAEKTIKIHRGRVMEKMAVLSVADLVRVSQAAGVTPLPS